MASLLRPDGPDQDEFLEYALVTDEATATLASALSQVLDRLQSKQGRLGEEGVAIRLAAQMRQAAQWCRNSRTADWNDLWLPPDAGVQ